VRAVNLIPADSRRRAAGVSASPQTLALIGVLALALAGVLLYVATVNRVSDRRTQLAQVTAQAAQARTEAEALAPFIDLSKQRMSQLAAVRQLAAARYPWPRMLDDLARLMPSNASLTSIQASTAGSGTGAAATTTTGPSVQLAGCASTQSAVAHTMDRLRGMSGLTDVALSSSTEASGGSSGSGGAAGSGGTCAFPETFQMTLTLASAATPATPTAAAPAAGSTQGQAR
jgi:Tfp pilus assembly protein PilN